MKNLTRKVQIVCGLCGVAILSAGCATIREPVKAFPDPYFDSEQSAKGFAAAYEQIIHSELKKLDAQEDEEWETEVFFTGAPIIVSPAPAPGAPAPAAAPSYTLEITVSPAQPISVKTNVPNAQMVTTDAATGSVTVTIAPQHVVGMQNVLVEVFDRDQYLLDTMPISVVESFPKAGTIYAKTQIEGELTSIKNFGETFSNTFYCMPVAITNRYDYPVKVSASSILLPMTYVARVDAENQELKMDPIFDDGGLLETGAYVVPFGGETYLVWDTQRMPLTMNTVLSLLEFDKRQDPNYRLIRAMRLVGSIAGPMNFFFTGADYSEWTGFFSSTLTNGLEKYLLDDILNNIDFITANALGESVTVPKNETVVKYVFFPKGDILGVHTPEAPARVYELREEKQIRLEGQVIIETQEANAVAAPGAKKSSEESK